MDGGQFTQLLSHFITTPLSMYEWTHSPKAPHKIGSFLILANMARELNTLAILKHLCAPAHVSFLMAWYCIPKSIFHRLEHGLPVCDGYDKSSGKTSRRKSGRCSTGSSRSWFLGIKWQHRRDVVVVVSEVVVVRIANVVVVLAVIVVVVVEVVSC